MEELGRKFKKRREKLGIELSTARDETNIRLDYLRAIEEGNFDRIEEEVYLKGFLKVYSNYLDLETEKIMEEYKQFKAQEAAETNSNSESEEETAVEFSWHNFVDKHQNLMLGLVVGGLILILVAGGVYLGTLAYRQFTKHNTGQKIKEYVGELAGENNNEEQESDPQSNEPENSLAQNQSQQQETTTEANKPIEQAPETEKSQEEAQPVEEQTSNQQSAATEKESESLEGQETNSQTEGLEQTGSTDQQSTEQEAETAEVPADQLTIQIRNIEESWYLVEVDDETVFRGTLEQGAAKEFSGQRIRVKIGNAAGVQIIKGDQTLGPFGKKGEVVTKVFSNQTNSEQE